MFQFFLVIVHPVQVQIFKNSRHFPHSVCVVGDQHGSEPRTTESLVQQHQMVPNQRKFYLLIFCLYINIETGNYSFKRDIVTPEP